MRLRIAVLVFVAGWLLVGSAGLAQTPTGTISGRVASPDGETLPGATVSVASPALQGVRTVVSSINGDYIVPLLPPGEYTVTFEMSGFETLKETRGVGGLQTVTLNVTMPLSAVTATVSVVAKAEPFVQTAQVATDFNQDLMATLPSNRTLDATVLMAPSVHATGPRGAFSLSGAQSYETLYTVNGVVTTENLRGSPFTLYIEDALQETTVAVSGISAEYGRFGGGVVNAVTKSGGNRFSGSFRTSFNNDSWRSFTPFESTQIIANPSLADTLKLDKTVPTYEVTMGGPVLQDRVWFFGAARVQKQESTRQTVGTLIPYVRTNDDKRYEAKLTYSPKPGHTLRASYIAVDNVLRNNTSFNVMDLASLTDQGQPMNLVSLHYSGIVRPNLFLEGQYSVRNLTFTDVGASTRDLIQGTGVTDQARGAWRYWSPTFCAGSTCDGDEQRDNNDIIVKGSYFLSSKSSGSHHLVFGYDRYNDKVLANTHANGSDYRIAGTTSIIRGTTVYPVFLPEFDDDHLEPDPRPEHRIEPADPLGVRQRQLAVEQLPHPEPGPALGPEQRRGRRRPEGRRREPVQPARVGRVGSAGGRAVGGQRELRALRLGHHQQRGVVDHRGRQLGVVPVGLPGAGDQRGCDGGFAADDRRRAPPVVRLVLRQRGNRPPAADGREHPGRERQDSGLAEVALRQRVRREASAAGWAIAAPCAWTACTGSTRTSTACGWTRRPGRSAIRWAIDSTCRSSRTPTT